MRVSLSKKQNTPSKIVPPISQEKLIFKGTKESPLLAPRGIFMTSDTLIIADTGQNRVFLWNELPTTEYLEGAIVLGQDSVEQTQRNAGGKLSASSLLYPSGIWTDGNKLIVCDAWNHRVLIWHEMPTQNGQPADIVVGQPDFTSNEPNVKGIGNDPTAQSLNWPYGCYVHNGKLFIADTGNRRVLVFNEIPTTNYAKADEVIGKNSFTERDYENTDAIWPYSVKISSDEEMIIADTQYYRALYWKDWKTAMTKKADIILGQNRFDDNGQNQYQLFPKEHTINWTYDACFSPKGILVADTGNSRIMAFAECKTNNPPATGLIGKEDFNTGSENLYNKFGTELSMYWPFSLCVHKQLLAIADTGNHRIIFHELKP